jgi:hypothetical protein
MKRAYWIILLQSLILISWEVSAQDIRRESTSGTVEDFSWIRDTVYTLMPYYIEVNLSTQKGYLYSRTAPVKEFGLSSGTSKLKDGVDTKTGLFVIQSKMEKWYSRQFDSTLMLKWMGFNWGIGFHALQGRGYYKYLGKRKSSHGCVRLTRDMAEELYTIIDEGTPVLVHEGYSAVKVAFCDSSEAFAYLRLSDLKYQLKKRLKEIYGGQYFVSYNPKLIIDFNNVGHEGLPIGDSRKIMKQQIIPPVWQYISASIPPPLGCTTFYKPIEIDVSSMGYKAFY